MIRKLLITGAMVGCIVASTWAHRVDEYLQSNYVSIERDRLKMSLFLVPGIAVLPTILADIDTDKDGTFSTAEQRSYASRVLADLTITLNGQRVTPRIAESTFASRAEMDQGLGGILIEVGAELPRGGVQRQLHVENHHHAGIAVYLVNCLVSANPDIRIGQERRNSDQSMYDVDYTQTEVPSAKK